MGLPGMGPMRGMQTIKVPKPMAALEPMNTFEDLQKADDERLAGWIKLVGQARATAAWTLLKGQGLVGDTGQRSTTLPELLTEVWLKEHGVRYEVQIDVGGWARPDFALREVLPAQILIARVQGTYWHSKTQGKDAGQKLQLLGTTYRGLPIGAVVDLQEQDIYDSPGAAFEAMLRGHSLRGD